MTAIVPRQPPCRRRAGPSEAMGVTVAHYRLPLDRPPFELYAREAESEIATGVRIGITKAAELPWRYGLKGSKFLSKPFKDR